jgi:hypothetical protein
MPQRLASPTRFATACAWRTGGFSETAARTEVSAVSAAGVENQPYRLATALRLAFGRFLRNRREWGDLATGGATVFCRHTGFFGLF